MNPQILTDLVAGEVIVPESQDYDQLRNVFNRAGNPAMIVRAQNNDDIVAAIRLRVSKIWYYQCAAVVTV